MSIDKASYRFGALKNNCVNSNNCWIQFQAPEDKIRADYDSSIILDLTSTNSYHSNEVFLLPLNLIEGKELHIQAFDSNQDKRFSKKMCIYLGTYDQLRWRNSFQWFLRTGSSLFSAYFLILISLFLGFSLWLRRSGIGFSLFIYSIISAFYLLSFSEYPRSFFDPVIASGGIHFPLRLLQDLSLVFVFYNFYQQSDKHKIITKLAWVYAAVIFVYILMLAVGIYDYKFYSRVIIIMAPLVAAPMAIGAFFSFKLKDQTERKVLIPASIILFLFQLNDLLVFWKLTNNYFTVRLYIPFIVGMSLFLYFRRIQEKESAFEVLGERQRIVKEFLHDIKSPLAVLRIFFASRSENEERTRVISTALDRIEYMILQIDQPEQAGTPGKFKISSALQEVIAQKRVEYRDVDIVTSNNVDVYVYADQVRVQRILSNVINNSVESYAKDARKQIEIKQLLGSDSIRIQITDTGCGIPEKVLNRLFKGEVSNKKSGKGIGLKSAYEYVNSVGGELSIISREKFGTTVEITFKTVTGDILLSEIEEISKQSIETPDLILIDDDKYIRLAWQLHAKALGKTIKTYDSISSFFEDSENLSKLIPIYIDVNLDGKRSLDYLSYFTRAGFTNLLLATGEDLSGTKLPDAVKGVIGKLPPIQ